MNEVRVVQLGPEAADRGVVELWQDHARVGITLIRDGEIVVELEPAEGSRTLCLGAHSLAAALHEAATVLTPHLSS